VLTVLLATRNRSRVFTSVLESFCQLRSPSSGWKLVVVDNGSTDQTSQVIASFANRLPLQSRREPKLGKNFALNAGLALVEGDLTVLTDDDVLPHEDWLIQLRNAADAQPEFSIFGGSVVPHWEVPPPSWIQWVEQGAAFAITDPTWREGPIAPNCIWGPNMAIRSHVFQSDIRFNTSMGPRGTNYLQGGDTELTRRLHQLGHNAWHVHRAVVEHFIRKEQLEKAWVMQRAIRHGRGEYRLGHAEEVTSRKLLLGTPRYLYRELYKEVREMTKAWLMRRREDLFRSHWRFNYVRGQIREARALSRERTAKTYAGTGVC
jgi:glycosyltransferase involved in cell wall biosynthesis